MKLFRAAIVSVLLFSGFANAATTLEFITPSGSVGPNESIEIWLRFSTDTDLFFDNSDPDGDMTYGDVGDFVPFEGFSPDANGGTGGFVEFDFIDDVFTNTSYTCSGSFSAGGTSVCPPGDFYEFDFNSSGPDSFSFLNTYFLGAGESEDFLFGTFIPVAGGAAPGTYEFFGASLGLFFVGEGTDDFGEIVSLTSLVRLATTCATDDSSCSFTRTVVPIPAAVWLFASALIALGARRK